ncbi:MAG: hypothetical protein ACM336_07275 [Acidobacteriota bacterium]
MTAAPVKRGGGQVWLLSAAGFAFLWVIARASRQAVTIDEADTYNAWIANPAQNHWAAHANNHILNTGLMRLFTELFGVSPFTIRIPALIGAAIYIAACCWLCRAIARERILHIPLFLCLVYNPFVMDHLVAARGYSMAAGFFLTGLAVVIAKRSLGSCALFSVCMGLSFVANFSFGFAAAAAVLVVAIRAWRSEGSLKTAAACALPAPAIALALASSTLLHWKAGQFNYGATSLRETFAGIAQASLYEVNPFLVPPHLYPVFQELGSWVLPLLGAAVLVRLVALLRVRPLRLEKLGPFAGLALLFGGILLVAVGAHRLAYRLFHLLMPLERTGLFLVPLIVLAIGALAAVPLHSRLGRISRAALSASLCLLSVYFLSCLRLTYFKTWHWNADSDKVYAALEHCNRAYGITDIAVEWRYAGVLNFYRREPLPLFKREFPPFPEDKQAYVLNVFEPEERAFIAAHRLKVVYSNPFTHSVIAVRPELVK